MSNTYQLSILIKANRDLKKLSQKQLAQKSKLSQSYISKIESNSIDPVFGNVLKILKALDLVVALRVSL